MMRLMVGLLALVALSSCATVAPIRVPVGQVAQWDYHAPAPCEPTWSTSQPAVAHVVADEGRVTVLGQKPGRATVRVVCGGVTYSEVVEVFRAK